MNGTPRLRSAFPATPQTNRSPTQRNDTPSSASAATPGSPLTPRLPDIKSLISSSTEKNEPLIPTDWLDVPSQRLYFVAIWLLLLLWRLYDYYNLTIDETESVWLWLKWDSIDFVLLFILESLRIPWLEFTPTTQISLLLGHVLFNAFLMFRIPLPFGAWLVSLVKYLYDKELAVSEHYVKPGSILHNPSQILGRQIIHILPEGSAQLNPDRIPLCLDPTKSSSTVTIPLQLNQTIPREIKFSRFDFSSSLPEEVSIPASQASKLRKEAMRGLNLGPSDPVLLKVPVKKPGFYRLDKVEDKSGLEVRRYSAEALVVNCPQAAIKAESSQRCRGDLSNAILEVQGTPPLQVTYSKERNSRGSSNVSYQSVQPEGFKSPIARQQGMPSLAAAQSSGLAWAGSHTIRLPLNEVLDEGGHISYSVNDVSDALGNKLAYVTGDEFDGKFTKPFQERVLHIHERPQIKLTGYSVKNPLKIREGGSVAFPLDFSSTAERAKEKYFSREYARPGTHPIRNTQHTISYRFTPSEQVTRNGEHAEDAKLNELKIPDLNQIPKLRQPGLYTIESVSTPSCKGDILEPSSFFLVNPPRPQLSISAEPIKDECAGKQVGFHVDFDLIGTPPFRIYFEKHRAGTLDYQYHDVDGPRSSLNLKPSQSGHHVYKFVGVSDEVYGNMQPLQGDNLVLEQDVKAAVDARFVDDPPDRQLCLDEAVTARVELSGEGPWTLEYETVHGGKRTNQKKTNLNESLVQLDVGPFTSGGEHLIVLKNVIDTFGCKKALQQDIPVNVRHQRPRASFGLIDGKRSVQALESKTVQIPLRLVGDGSWTMEYQHVEHRGHAETEKKTTKNANDILRVMRPGKYKILKIQDSQCPGVVDESAREFEISWIPRPSVFVQEKDVLSRSEKAGKTNDSYTRKDVCEGEEDALDIFFNGKSPYDIRYQIKTKPDFGGMKTKSIQNKDIQIPGNSVQIKMDTSQAGSVEYTFSELGDKNYDFDPSRHVPLQVTQRVQPRPSATFANVGKVYSFCHSQSTTNSPIHTIEEDPRIGEEIPILLSHGPTGSQIAKSSAKSSNGPFTLDVLLRRQGKSTTGIPLTYRDIVPTNSKSSSSVYNLRIPSKHLSPGTFSLTILRVRDNRDCERNFENNINAPRVQLSVHDLPSIAPTEEKKAYCVGEHIAFSLSGVAPFTIFYEFDGRASRVTESSPTFRRLAHKPGNFTITGIADSASHCRRDLRPQSKVLTDSTSSPAQRALTIHQNSLTKHLHPLPSVRISKGLESRVDIHAGSTYEILFEFTYTRSEILPKHKQHSNVGPGGGYKNRERDSKGGKVLEMKTLVSEDFAMRVGAMEEGTYEVVSVRDGVCVFSVWED